MKRISLIILIVGKLLGQSEYIYNYAPDNRMFLGRGFSKADYNIKAMSPITYVVNSETNSATDFAFDIYLIQDEKSLSNIFNIDSRIDSRSLGAKLSGKFDLSNTNAFKSNTITLLIEAKSTFGAIYLDSINLKEEAKAMLNTPNGITEFVNLYGEEIVTEINRGVHLGAIIVLSDVANETRRRLGINLAGTFKYGLWTTNVKTTITKELIEATRTGRTEIKIVGSGGPGISSLADLIKINTGTENNLQNIQSLISDYIKKLTVENSVPISYKTTPIKNIGVRYSTPWVDTREKELIAIKAQYKEAKSNIDKIDYLINDNSFVKPLLDSIKIKELEKYKDKYEELITELITAHEKYKSDPRFKYKIKNNTNINWDKYEPQLPVYSLGLRYYGYGLSDKEQAFDNAISPIQHFRQSPSSSNPFMSGLTKLDPLEQRIEGDITTTAPLQPQSWNQIIIISKDNNGNPFKYIEEIKVLINDVEVATVSGTENTNHSFLNQGLTKYNDVKFISINDFFQTKIADVVKNINDALDAYYKNHGGPVKISVVTIDIFKNKQNMELGYINNVITREGSHYVIYYGIDFINQAANVKLKINFNTHMVKDDTLFAEYNYRHRIADYYHRRKKGDKKNTNNLTDSLVTETVKFTYNSAGIYYDKHKILLNSPKFVDQIKIKYWIKYGITGGISEIKNDVYSVPKQPGVNSELFLAID